MNKTNLVWYVCYGSNLCYERFMCYLTGEPNTKYNIPSGKRCNNPNPPLKKERYDFEYRLYFADYIGRWNGPVAYLEKNKLDNKETIGRAYLITNEQYKHVKGREGSKYQYEIILGEKDGIPIKTFTLTDGQTLTKENHISNSYRQVMIDGLKELGLSKEDANLYIDKHL